VAGQIGGLRESRSRREECLLGFRGSDLFSPARCCRRTCLARLLGRCGDRRPSPQSGTESLPLGRCCRRIGRCCAQDTRTTRPIRSRKRVGRLFAVHERINRVGVRKIVRFTARTGPQGRHVPLDLADLHAVGNPARTGTAHAWLSTPTPYRWSVRLGCPFPSRRGEGNNSPIGAGGATRLTGITPAQDSVSSLVGLRERVAL
jgi:hypothetical protein